MVIAIDIKKVHQFVIKKEQDLPAEQQTVFSIKTLTSREVTRLGFIAPKLMKKNLKSKVASNLYAEICQIGLAGWENFKDNRGQDIPFSTKLETLDVLPPEVLTEIGLKILELNTTDDKVKN